MSPIPDEKNPSTKDSAESYKNRPLHAFETVSFRGEDYPVPGSYKTQHETIEASEKLLETESKGPNAADKEEENEDDDGLTKEMKEEIAKEKGFDNWNQYMNAREISMGLVLSAIKRAKPIYMTKEEFHKRAGL